MENQDVTNPEMVFLYYI